MFRDLDATREDEFYDRILAAWRSAQQKKEDPDLWFSRFILDIAREDRQCAQRRGNRQGLARILLNCLILVLALFKMQPADLQNINNDALSELPGEERAQILRQLANLSERLGCEEKTGQ